MAQRLNVLISAYACEPDRGSEPEVGWQWALQMARFHDVTVLTRANNRAAIEAGLAALRGGRPLPVFVYHDRHAFLTGMKRWFGTIQLYYLLWQKSAREVIARLHAVHPYDLMHHVTFAGFRYPAAVWGHRAPCIWGPVGGIESIPAGLLPWRHPGPLIRETLRNGSNLLHAAATSSLPRRARATTLVLASTPEMQRTFARLGVESRLMPTIGLNPAELPYREHVPDGGPLKMVFVGNMIALKGLDLALDALKAAGGDATLTLIGDGSYLPAAKGKTEALGLAARVIFKGRLPREQVLRLYAEYDLFFFPSLHDTGGCALIEAMCSELAVLCLDCGGPAVAVRQGCGIKVPLGPRARVVAGLTEGIRFYALNRSILAEHGKAARQAILRDYDWDMKGEQMNQCYQEAVARYK
ncbi:MAG: glycosyltransferase family 4 protein [Limisphaerales bacterium]